MKRREFFTLLFAAAPAQQAVLAPVEQPAQVTIELDGRVLAEALISHLPDVIRRQGMS